MTERYLIPAEEIRREMYVSNSRFISTLAPVFSVEEAKTFIRRIRDEFPDATHNVPAYRVGSGSSVIDHASDDGEPSGTAGRPMLAVLRGSSLGDAAVVVTRYFGGTKLGKGGLVRAYSDAVRAVIQDVQRAEKVLAHTIMAAYPYNLIERVRLLVEANSGEILDETFTAEVTLTARFPVGKLDEFQAQLNSLTNGQVQGEILETREVIMPVDSGSG